MNLDRENLENYFLKLIEVERQRIEAIARGQQLLGFTERDSRVRISLLRRIREELGLVDEDGF